MLSRESRVRHPLKITHPGVRSRKRPGVALPPVSSGERHFRFPCGADSLTVGKRSGCVFQRQGRTNSGVAMPYQYVKEPLTADEADRLSGACETPTERLVVWTLLDTGLRVGELCSLTVRNLLWQQRQLRVKGKSGRHGQKTKVRVVPMSNRVRALLEHHFALEKTFPVRTRRAQDIVKAVADRAGITRAVSPHVLAPHVRHDRPAEGDQPADGAEDPGPRQPPDDSDLPQLHRRAHPG